MKYAHAVTPLIAALLLAAASVQAAETQLYDTGPSEDASFLRFVNGSTKAIAVVSGGKQAQIALDAAKPSTDYFPVKAKTKIEGAVTQGAATRAEVSLTVAPGEFATVIALPDGSGLKTITIGETPDDFNSMKASLAFYSADPACAQAGLNAAGRSVALFENVPVSTLQRRAVNPVKLGVQLMCGGKNSGAALELGDLQAGTRYSVFAVPSEKGPRLFTVTDALAR
jgi:hypothetical protein